MVATNSYGRTRATAKLRNSPRTEPLPVVVKEPRKKEQCAYVQHMAKWMQSGPKVTAWLSLQYDDGDIPDWVGKFEGIIDYVKSLAIKGVAVPMEDTASVHDHVHYDDADDSED
jgi:hypothetical protein